MKGGADRRRRGRARRRSTGRLIKCPLLVKMAEDDLSCTHKITTDRRTATKYDNGHRASSPAPHAERRKLQTVYAHTHKHTYTHTYTSYTHTYLHTYTHL